MSERERRGCMHSRVCIIHIHVYRDAACAMGSFSPIKRPFLKNWSAAAVRVFFFSFARPVFFFGDSLIAAALELL